MVVNRGLGVDEGPFWSHADELRTSGVGGLLIIRYDRGRRCDGREERFWNSGILNRRSYRNMFWC